MTSETGRAGEFEGIEAHIQYARAAKASEDELSRIIQAPSATVAQLTSQILDVTPKPSLFDIYFNVRPQGVVWLEYLPGYRTRAFLRRAKGFFTSLAVFDTSKEVIDNVAAKEGDEETMKEGAILAQMMQTGRQVAADTDYVLAKIMSITQG